MSIAQLRAHMAAHHGVASRQEARELGVSDSSLRRMIGRGEVVRAHPGVYRAAAHPRTWMSTARSIALSSGGVISHRAAAALWGIDGFPFALQEATIGYEQTVRMPGATLHRSKQLSLIDDRTIEGIPVTGIARTILDVAGVVGPKRLDLAIDAVLRMKLLDWPDLYEVLVRHSAKGRNGCGKLRKILDVRYGDMSIPDSLWNRNVGTLLADAGLPEPAYEHEIVSASGDFVARVDLAYPRRKNSLLLEGWKVLTFTWADYVGDPTALVKTVRASLL